MFVRVAVRACADPGIFVRGVQIRLSKKALTSFFYFCPQLILRKSNGQFQRNLSFFKVPEGVQHFPGGSNFSQGGGGSNCLFAIETHITCDFPGGRVRTPVPPSGSALGEPKDCSTVPLPMGRTSIYSNNSWHKVV